MLSYNELKTKPREFLAATGLYPDEFARLLPAFRAAYDHQHPPALTQAGTARKRRAGGGATGALPHLADKLFFILVYHKTHPLQTLHGLHFGLSQPQTNFWIHRLLPLLQQALRDLGEAPERDAQRVAASPLAVAAAPDLQVDGTERRRQRPQAAGRQQAHYSGKKRAPTDKNLLVTHSHTRKVVYLSPTVPGKTHDKRAADDAQIGYPPHALLDKDTGFQGYEPATTLTRQPKKSRQARG